MKSYKTPAVAKQQATSKSNKTGIAHTFYQDGAEFFVITQAEWDIKAVVKEVIEEVAEEEEVAEVAVQWPYMIASEMKVEKGWDWEAASAELKAKMDAEAAAKVVPVRVKMSKVPAGVGAASWKWILAHMPEGEIEEVKVRHGNGKRFNLDVNGVNVWYSFTEEGANAAKVAVLALKKA